MPARSAQPAIRGAIKVSVDTSTSDLVGGQNFTVFVTVTNPFEVPISLTQVSTNLPPEFFDLDRLDREVEARRRRAAAEGSSGPFKSFGRSVAESLGGLRRVTGPGGFSFELGPIVTATASIARELGTPAVFDADELEVDVGTEPRDDHATTRRRPRVFEVKGEGTESRSLGGPRRSAVTVLQPGNSTTRTFTIRSRLGMRFRPSRYKINIEIAYEIESVPNRETLSYSFQVRAPLASVLAGGLIGGAIGWFAKNGTHAMWGWETGLNALAAMLLAFMGVLLLARKRDIQPVVSIEDFWGGLTVGFLVAYSGSGLISQLIGTSASGH